MASGRVGGTHSRISGEVGNLVYTARKNSDGKYVQVISEKPATREDTLTEAKVKQRMCMSVCYRYMEKMSDVITRSFNSKQSANLNLNQFVSINVKALRAYMDSPSEINSQIWWYDYGDENIYPASMQFGFYDTLPPVLRFASVERYQDHFVMAMQFEPIPNGLTYGEWFRRVKLSGGDRLAVLLFVGDEDPVNNRIVRIRLTLRNNLDLNTPLTSQSFTALWTSAQDLTYRWQFDNLVASDAFRPNIVVDSANKRHAVFCACTGWLRASFIEDRWVFDTKEFNCFRDVSRPVRIQKYFEDVWPSWYDNRL